MTQEQHQKPSQTPILTEELPMRRSRSLSELPGHIRVPILRRQDTARTQARLEAGAAGVEELRVLRKQQEQMIDQTMSASQQKRKHPVQQRLAYSMTDHHRVQYKQHLDHARQHADSSCSPISAWYSTSHLASISEEWDSTSNDATKKYFSGNSVNVTSNPKYQENTTNTFDNNKFIGNVKNSPDSSHYPAQSQCQLIDSLTSRNECSTQHHSLGKNFQHHDKVQNHSQEKIFTSSTVKTEEQTRADKHKTTTHDNFSHKNAKNMHVSNDDKDSKPPNQFVQTRRRSMSQSYIQCRDKRNDHNQADIRHKQNIHTKSDQHVSRGRSQSVYANFAYFCDGKENECECKLPHKISLKTKVVDKVHNSRPDIENIVHRHLYLQDLESKSSSNFSDQLSTAARNNSTSEHKDSSYTRKCGKPSLSYLTASCLHPLQTFSPQSRSESKSISWDNLLVAIGLHNECTVVTNEIKEQDYENIDDVFINSTQVSKTNSECPASPEIEEGCVVQRKKTRSQSFTSVSLLNPNSKSGILKTEHPAQSSCRKHENVSCQKSGTEDCEYNKIGKRHSLEHHKQTTNEIISTSLLRRASIQCDAVLTQTGTAKRILNPLQDVDINSLQSPGPLHAVTLQYTSVPMRNASDSCVITASNSYAAPKEKLTPPELSSKTQVSCSVTSSQACHSLHHFTESGHSSEPVSQAHLKSENSKVIMTEHCDSKLVQQNIQKEHPVPRPRTSILKAFSQQTIPHTNYSPAKEISEINSNALVIVNKTSVHEENFSLKDTKSDTGQLQNSVVSDLPVINSTIPTTEAPNHQPKDHTNMKNTFWSSLESDNQKLPTKSENKDLSNLIQNTDLSCSVAESGKKESCSVADSERAEVKIIKEQDRKFSNILENLSIWMNSHRVNKANSNLNGDISALRPGAKSINKSLSASPQMPLFNYMDHVTEDKSQKREAKTNGSKSSFCFPHQKQFVHTPDVSILSDEGYSTCDSISQQLQLFNNGHSQLCDINAPRSDSITSMGFLGDLPCLPDNCGSSFQTQCAPSKMEAFNSSKCSTIKETGAHNFDIENAIEIDNSESDCYTRHMTHLNVKQDSTVISELDSNQNYGNCSTILNHNCESKDKQSQQTADATKLSNQETSTNKHDYASIGDNSKDDQINIIVTKLEEHTNEEIKFVTNHSNDSVQSKVKDVTHSFKQTAV